MNIKLFILRFILYSFTVFIILFLYGKFYGAKGLIVKEYYINNDNIPNSFNGLKIVHFTDAHYGVSTFQNEIDDIVHKINSLEPDIVFFTGDLIDRHKNPSNDEIDALSNSLKNIKARLGKYSVYGNHDSNGYYADIMNDSGFDLLKNDNITIYNGTYDPLIIYGFDSLIIGEVDVHQTFKVDQQIDSDYLSILLLHEPVSIENINKTHKVNYAFAGHSHGGQVRIPFIGSIITPYGTSIYKSDHHIHENTDLYISYGIGTTLLPVRLFNKPSINLYRFSN